MTAHVERKGPFLDITARYVLDYIQNNMGIPEGTRITSSNVVDVMHALDFVLGQNKWLKKQYRRELKIKDPKDLPKARKHMKEKAKGRLERFTEMVAEVGRFVQEQELGAKETQS